MTLSRRDLLKGLTAAAALPACSRHRTAPRIGGSIVGGAHGRGHRARDGAPAAPDAWESVPIVVMGGGVAGLSAAWALERAGLRDFTVLELEDGPGGTARSGQGAITPYPWGAHYVPVPAAHNRVLVALLDEVGAIAGRDAAGRPVYAENVLCRDPQERVFFGGEWQEGLFPRAGARAEDAAHLEAFEADMKRWGQWRDPRGRRGFEVPRARGSDAPEIRALDEISMADYLARHGWTSPRLLWFVEYACRDDFGATLAQTSAWAGIHYFAARQDETGETADFLTWPDGNGRLVRHLAGIAGPRVRLGATVLRVTSTADGVDVVYRDEKSGRTRGLHAEHAVFALPGFLVPYLVEGAPRAAPVTYGSWMVANLTLRDRPRGRGFPMAWDNVLYDSPSLGYVVATHQTGRDQGATVLTYYLPLVEDDAAAGRRRLLETPWEAWVQAILRDLGPAHPGFASLVETVDVYLWGHAMVRPSPRSAWSADLAQRARPLGRLHFAHTDLSGMALFEEAQYWGVSAAEAILRDRRHPHRAWLA